MNQYINIREGIEKGTRILFPESGDIRVLIAAITLSIEGIIQPVLLGDRDSIKKILSDVKLRTGYSREVAVGEDLMVLENIEIIGLDSAPRDTLVDLYNQKKGGTKEHTEKIFPTDLAQAAQLLKNNTVAGVVAGSIATTADVIRTGYYGVGLKAGSRIAGEFIMTPGPGSTRDDIYIIGDAAVNPDPTASELVGFAHSLIQTHRVFRPGVVPRVAFLSFSTYGSGAGTSVDKVREASQLFLGQSDIESDGPLQFDAATDYSKYQMKTNGIGRLTAPANILVFPDLTSGNITYKSLESHGGYGAIGPILTGYQLPWSDLSRGTSIQTIIDMAYVTARMSQK